MKAPLDHKDHKDLLVLWVPLVRVPQVPLAYKDHRDHKDHRAIPVPPELVDSPAMPAPLDHRVSQAPLGPQDSQGQLV